MPSASDQLPPESGHSHEAGLPPGLWEDLRRAFEPRYELRGLLGRGGMGVVIEAWDPVLERPLAIKILSPGDLSQDPTARERLLREARAAATLSHPNVVSVFGVGETPELRAPYILMQRVLGETLERKEQDGGTIGVAEAVRLLGEIAEALTAAHARGMVHRDLKPSNVMVEGSTGRAVVLDFGISHFTPTPGREQVKLTGTGMQVGTPLYMSPEQAAGEPATDKSDIYSLGCLMYEVLSGRPVFEGPTAMVVMASHIKDTPAPIRTLRPEVPEALERVVASMLAKDPASRPSADDLRRRFAPAPDHHPWWEGSAELMRRRARAVLLTGSALAVLALIQYAILTGAFPAAPPLVRSGLIGAFSVTLLLYVGASVAAFLALRRDPIPPAVVQLIAGDWAGEGGLVVDRLRQYAGVGPAEQGALLRAIRWRGLVALSAGSATLGVLALIVLLPGASAVPASIRWSLLLLPSIAVLACTVRLERLREPYDPGLRLRFGPAPRLAGWGRFQQWLAEHASAFTTLGSGTGSPLRSLLATLNLGLAALGVVILVGLQVFAVQVRDAMGVPAFDRLGAEREEFLPLYAMAGPPASFLPEDSARVVWDRFLVAPWYLPRDSAEALMSRVGMGRTLRDLDRLGLRPRRREESGAVLIAAGFRGFTAERRRVLTELVAAQGTDELRSASRSRAALAWPAVVDRLGGRGTSIVEIHPPLYDQALFATYRHLIAAALAVDAGRVDSAEALLWEVIRFARLEDARARNLNDEFAAARLAQMAASGLRAIYAQRQDVRRLVGLLRPEPLPKVARAGMPPATGDKIRDIVGDELASPGIRWEALATMRLRGCGDPRVLLGAEDPGYAAAAAVARRDLPEDRADSLLLGLIDQSLENAATMQVDEPPPGRAGYLLLAELARSLGRRSLAGCLKMYGGGYL